MATVYIQPGSGSGSGTKSDPYYYDELGTAETAAGNGGTILFTDGTYNFSANQTWDAATLADMTYKSENDRGAYLFGVTSMRQITLGSSSTSTFKIEGFKAANINYVADAATTLTVNKIVHADTFSGTRNPFGFFELGNSNSHVIKNSSFLVDYSGTDLFFRFAGATTITSCTFFIKCTAV